MTRRPAWLAAFLLPAMVLLMPGPDFAGESLKGQVRSWFGLLADAASEAETATLPEGMKLISLKGCKGLQLEPARFRIEPMVWATPAGLRDEIGRRNASGAAILAGINGAFYSDRGVLGQVVIDGALPAGIRQIPGPRSRCFIASLRGPAGTRWILGETASRGIGLLAPTFLAGATLNRPIAPDESLESLLGGGGWIVRQGRDVHMEAYQRQRFRFRKADQDSRHTVLAMDDLDRLYLLVFETGSDLSTVSAMLRNKAALPGITDAIFLDGGSSSVLVAGDRYLVAPLYLLDKARFSALVILAKR